jgi:hypothetical protein
LRNRAWSGWARLPKACRIAAGHVAHKEAIMAKSQQKSNKEVRKPKAEKVKTNASNPTTKGDPVKMVTIKQ